MAFFKLPIDDIFAKFDKQWALVTAGNAEDFNTMTVSWGGLGTLWNKPVATVYVRPSRYTHEYLEREPLFTVGFFGEEFKKDLALLGRYSGRDCDKVGMTGLTPMFFTLPQGRATAFQQAELTLVCRKIYAGDMDKSLIDPGIAGAHYEPEEPAHTMYIGEVINTVLP